MKKVTALAFALAIIVGPASHALADEPGADWMPIDQVVQKLMAAGYTNISEIEADDGRWEGKGMKNGQKMEVHVDPRTGAIISEKPD